MQKCWNKYGIINRSLYIHEVGGHDSMCTIYSKYSVHQSDGLRKETGLVSGCSGVQCSAVPTIDETLEQVVSRV